MSAGVSMESERPSYGNLRRVRLPGLGRLSGFASAVLLVGSAGLLLLLVFSLWMSVAWAVLVLLVVAPDLVPSADGYSRYSKMLRKVRHSSAERSGRTLLRQGLAGYVPDGACRLPGLAATVELSTHRDVQDNEFALVSWPAVDLHAVVIQCFPPGLSGLDGEQVDLMVARWGAWMGQLNKIGPVAGAQVVVESAPDSGQRLARAMERGKDPDGPAFSRLVSQQVLAQYRVGSPVTSTMITVTFSGRTPGDDEDDGGRDEARTVADMAEEIGSVLPTLTGTLAETGAGTGAYACTASELTDATRVAFDPGVAEMVEEAQISGEGTGLTWDQAGPISHDNEYSRYVHESAVSRTWQMREAPHGEFFAETFRALMSPHKDADRKRVTVLYRPESPERSRTAAEGDVTKALLTASQNKRVREANQVAVDAARKSARQESKGAPLVRVGMLVTVTVLDQDRLRPASRAVTRTLSAGAGLRMRVPRGAQDSSFVAALPLGMVTPAHLGVPDAMRGAL